MSHELAERLAGLASRVNNLVIHHSGEESRRFLDEQDRLVKLLVVAIGRDMDDKGSDYKAALGAINQLGDLIGKANRSVDEAGKVLRLITKLEDQLEKTLNIKLSKAI